MKKNKLNLILVFISLALLVTSVPITAYSDDMNHQNIMPLSNTTPHGNDVEKGPDWYTKPSSYSELVSWYQTLESTYPDYIEIYKANDLYGTNPATGNYDLYYVRITNESLGLHKPEVVFQGSPHGDETVGTIGQYWFTDWLMRMAFTDEPSPLFSKNYLRYLIDHREIYLPISHNPYGFDNGPQRYDGNGWDLNREYDFDGPGSPTGGIWASENGQTFRQFVDSHLLMIGCDWHGGARMLIYPWADTHANIQGTSPISGTTYTGCPPDFYYYDAVSLRLGDFMGDYGGDLNPSNIGSIHDIIWYSVQGGSAPWAYAADVDKNPVEDPYVNDETFGNYPGAGMLWITPEMSNIKNPSENTFGNDTVHRYGAEVRRFILHQTDLAEPYLQWQKGTTENEAVLNPEEFINFSWMVNGSMVVDHTYIQYGTDPDPINNPQYTTTDYDDYEGEYIGGTGWENALNGQINGVTYSESLNINTPGEYYFVAKAQVDQVYANVLNPQTYGNTPYLRMIKQRTDPNYYESLVGVDGLEEVIGQTWWYSPIIHVTVIPETGSPDEPTITGPTFGKPETEYTFEFTASDPEGEQVYYYIDWGDGTYEDWIGPYDSGETIEAIHTWADIGDYTVKAKAKDINGARGIWSDPYAMHIGLPTLELDIIEGGLLRAQTQLINNGDAEATDINWDINLDGGLILLGKESSGTISYLGPGEAIDLKTGLVFGFGRTRIIVQVTTPESSDVRTQNGLILLFIVNVSPGGG